MKRILFRMARAIYSVPRNLKLFILRKRLGYCGKDVAVFFPCRLSKPSNVFISDYVLIQPGSLFIIDRGKVFIGKWASIANNFTVITDNHVPTVGVNHRILGKYHINDRVKDIHIGDECWIGFGVTLMNGVTMGRGSVAAAGALVNKDVPPYAVVAGIPAKIIASVFSKDQILEHEKMLYPENERMSNEELDMLFDAHFKGKNSIGIEGVKDCDKKIMFANRNMQYSVSKWEL